MRKNPPAKWTLPNTVHPTTSTEWCVPVPDDPFYRAAFLGALADLGAAYKWQDDLAHTAKDVAQVWRDIADNLERCHGEIETIAEEWEDSLAICESLRWNNGVLEGFCCGEWAPIDSIGSAPIPGDTTQPSSGSRPAVGASTCFNRSMGARDIFLVPFGVQNGDIVTVTALSGAWSNDGTRWTCTDGTPFALGICAGSRYHDAGDPDPITLFHGQLMLDVGGQLLSGTDGPVTMSGLTGQQQLTIRPNFLVSADTGGTIQYRICVQAGGSAPPIAWCRYVDFSLSDFGFGTGSANIAYLPGHGFEGTGSCNGDHTVQFPTPPVDQVLTKLVLYFEIPPDADGLLCTYVTGTGCIATETPASVTTFLTPGLNGTQANNVVLWESGPSCTANAILTAMEISGTGTPPTYGASC